MIGEAGEDYVLEAGNNVVKPRSRWKILAACAACAALIAAAYPIYRAAHPALHDYTVMEGGSLTTQGDVKAPAGSGADAPAPAPSEAYVGGDAGQEGIDGAYYGVPGQDAPAQEAAMEQYDNFWRNLGLSYAEGEYPEWCSGVWIDNSYQPEARLAVAIVDGFRTPELEAQIVSGCGGEVIFKDVKYTWAHLKGLMEQVVELLDGTGLCCGIGVDGEANCLGVDLYSDQAIPDEILAELARLDPDGDAIRVRVFAGQTINTDIVKGCDPGIVEGPVPEPAPIDGDEQDPPAEVSIAPGGARPIEDYEQDIPAETAQPAIAEAE